MYKLVIIDDEENIAEGIANLFPWAQLGFEAVYFCKGSAALEYIGGNRVDVVMSDIEMPDMNGIEICKRLAGSVRIVFFSSYQKYEFFRSAIQYQVEDYLLKPLKNSDILNCFSVIKEKLDAENCVSAQSPPTYYEQIINKVKDYVKENYREASLEDAAELVGLSTGYLSRLFKEKNDCGFGEFVTRVRMDEACAMLDDFHNKSYDIAFYIGYDNPKNFSRAFKAYFGVTPREYRNNKHIKDE